MPAPDQTVPIGVPVTLQGEVNYSNTTPVIQWAPYSGPGAVTFGNAALTNTMATFNAPGVYTLELSAADGVHAVAYAAAVFTTTSAINLSIALTKTNVNLSWTGGTAPFLWCRKQGRSVRQVHGATVTTNPTHKMFSPLMNATEFFFGCLDSGGERINPVSRRGC